ncbi:MAG: sugar phosphate isomerase/epimerase [Opitutaceae bacterium]|nr:sugar phosphate isomerase/epimerase [Opitutaceae bacterium]
MKPPSPSRREFLQSLATATLATALPAAATPAPFRLRHVLSTNQYGTLPIADIVPQLAPAGCIGLDIWAGRWGNQREQIDAMGHDRFAALLAQHRAAVSCYTCMDPGFQRCEPHLRAMKKFGGNQIIAGFPNAPGGKELRGAALRTAIRGSLEKLKPIIAIAGELGVELAIENHLNGLLETPDGVRMLAEEIRERHVGIALAPFHLPQEAASLGQLVDDVAPKILYFYAWQFGDGSGDLAPSRQRRQLPGVGPLDFKPMLAALKRHRFAGYTSIFMHPTPRGAPLHSTVKDVTAELNKARTFLERELAAA